MSATIAGPELVTQQPPQRRERDLRALLLVLVAVAGWGLVVTFVLLGFLLANAAG